MEKDMFKCVCVRTHPRTHKRERERETERDRERNFISSFTGAKFSIDMKLRITSLRKIKFNNC